MTNFQINTHSELFFKLTSAASITAVEKTDSENGYIFIKGAVPGPKGSWVTLSDAIKIKSTDDLPLPAGVKGHDIEEAPQEEVPQENNEDKDNGGKDES